MQEFKMFSLPICLMILSTQALGQPPEHFDYTVTHPDISHSLLVAEATLDGERLVVGDEIGVFTPDDLCAGAGVVEEDGRTGLTAWGDDPDTDEVDGFRNDEAFHFKLWDADADCEYDAEANFTHGPEVFTRQGVSRLELEAESNHPPEVVEGIDDLEVNEDSGQHEIADLDDVFSDPDDDELIFEIVEGIDELNLLINDDTHILTLEPAENYFGESNVIIEADDEQDEERVSMSIHYYPRRDLTAEIEFAVTILPVNDPPGEFDLVSPEDGFSGIDPETYQDRLEWSEATDVDNEELVYSLFLHLNYNDIDTILSRSDIAATEYEFENLKESIAETGIFSEDTLNLDATWWVEASDGELSTESTERRTLIVPVPLSVTSGNKEIPYEYSLSQVYPNPFNSMTTITYTLPTRSNISLNIYNTRGQLVDVLLDRVMLAGRHSVVWDGSDLSSGVYLVRMRDEDGRMGSVQKVVLVK